MPSLELDGITIPYDDIGTGEVLLLVHGHPFDRTMWRPQHALAGTGWRVIAPDLRGYGASTAVAGTVTLDVFARDLVALLDHLGVARAVVGGLSMGGQIVMELCRQAPARVRGIVLAATFPQAETEAGRHQRYAMASRLVSEGMAGYAEEVLPKMIGGRSLAARPEIADHVLGMMRATRPEAAAAALRGRAERPPYDDVLASMDVPALIVVGSDDAFTTRGDAERMAALLGRSTLCWIEGVGHMPNLEAPGVFNDALATFLAVVSATSPRLR